MTPAFLLAIASTLHYEGGVSDHPADSGQWTKWGLSSRYHPEVKNSFFSFEDCLRLYFEEYWQPIAGDAIAERSKPLANLVFDCQVSQGRGGQFLQEGLNVLCGAGLTVDGKVGAKTLTNLRTLMAFQPLIGWMMIRRGAYWIERTKADPKNLVFLRGWMRRALYDGERLT